MTKRGWLRRWRHRHRWRKAERSSDGLLREFVYLDEVSVYSLVASQVGLIVTELTETQATSLQSEISSRAGVSAALKADVASKLQASEGQSSQVLRKAIIQTTFKQLLDTVTRSGALRVTVSDEDAPEVGTLDDVKLLARDAQGAGWVVEPSQLRRGDLVEMEVQLEAEPIFQASAVISGVLEIIQDDPAAFGLRDLAELGQVRLVSRMLEKVLAGLVPVRGRAANFEAVEIEGEEWLLHRNVLAQLPAGTVESHPVFLVGVAQEDLFWKDVRRVLFSGSSYRVLARLNRAGLTTSWTPVKLVDVLRDVIPDFADVMDTMNRGVISAMSSAVASKGDSSRADSIRTAKVDYATSLADRVGVDMSEGLLIAEGLLDADPDESAMTVRDWREVLEPVTSFIEQQAGRAVDREVAADYRATAIIQAGLLEPSTPILDFDADLDDADERFLDSEIVAVYW